MEPLTLGQMAEKYREMYGLTFNPSDINGRSLAHDCVHAMTGLGIGGVNELRILFVGHGLIETSPFYFPQILSSKLDIYRDLFSAKRNPNAGFSPYETPKSHLANFNMAAISPAEAEALARVGEEIMTSLRQIFGHSADWHKIPQNEIAALPFDQFDFSGHVYAVTKKFELPRNRRVERMARNIVEQKAIREGADARNMPAYGTPWTAAFKR